MNRTTSNDDSAVQPRGSPPDSSRTALRDALHAPLRRAAILVSAVAFVLALFAAGVRLLPWAFDPTVPWRVVAPFARALAAVAAEAALLLGWPLGWSLALARFVDRGEARVFALLGESPRKTIERLVLQGLAFAAVLALLSFLGGLDARAPGRVVDELIAEGRSACVAAHEPRALTVPFVDAAWLCEPGSTPRLLVESPIGGTLVTATDAHVAPDLRRVDLDDARFDLGPPLPPSASGASVSANTLRPTRAVRLHVAHLALSGLPPWARASVLPAAARAALVALAGLASALFAAYLILAEHVKLRLVAIAHGAAGPVATLGLLRLLERTDAARPSWYLALLLAPPLGLAAVVLARRAVAAIAARLPPRRGAAS